MADEPKLLSGSDQRREIVNTDRSHRTSERQAAKPGRQRPSNASLLRDLKDAVATLLMVVGGFVCVIFVVAVIFAII